MTGEFLWNLDQRKGLKMAQNSIFWRKKLRQIFLALGIYPKFLGVVNNNIFEWLESFCEILIRGNGLNWQEIAIFGIKNTIFGHFNPHPLIRISQTLSSHSKILSFTTPKNFGQIPSVKKIWRNFLCQKMLFLAIFTHFLQSKSHKNSPVNQTYQHSLLLEI